MSELTALDTPRCLIITGADGYIGGHLKALALARGWKVTVLYRRGRKEAGGARAFAWTLGAPIPAAAIDPAVPASRHALIHLAHDWSGATPGPNEGALNLEGTRALLESFRASGLGRFVFVSSQSARPDAANVYGRLKWRIEQLLAGDDEVAARVGLVYGGLPRAMFGLLSRLTAVVPVLPMVDPWREVQPIHVDEVCEGLLRIAAGRGGGWRGLAAANGMSFAAFLRTLAHELHGRGLWIVPIPLHLALLACDGLNRLPIPLRLDRERILGLAGTRPMACATHLQALDLRVEPLATRLRIEPASHKAVLTEGRALLAYILGGSPGRALTKRYARAVGRHGPLALPWMVRRAPFLLRLAEPFAYGSALTGRLAMATALAEASPEGESAVARGGRTTRLLSLAGDLTLDALFLPVRIVAGILHERRQ
jgi:nucleoside-diphosphate-sugar epimerase